MVWLAHDKSLCRDMNIPEIVIGVSATDSNMRVLEEGVHLDWFVRFFITFEKASKPSSV